MILQFGAGNFLRAFADLFIDELDRQGQDTVGPIVVVQSTGRERADALNRANGNYHVAIRGFQNGEVVDRIDRVSSIERTLYAGTQWNEVLDAARRPDLTGILSNTTEAGLALDDRDQIRGPVPPHSFPAKLLEVLLARHAAELDGPWIIPCELVESNGDRLRDLVLQQGETWAIPESSLAWLKEDCRWTNTLVDRIVPGPPKSHPLLGEDPLLLSAEPFAFWAVETSEDSGFPLAAHPAVVIADDISPFSLRKVRILNGAHSALVCKALGSGVDTVRDCVDHDVIGPWLNRLLFDEIVPVLEDRCPDPAGFARDTLDRFRNPFLNHQLSAIALNHDTKIDVRLRPTFDDYRTRFKKAPPLLSELLES